MHGTKLPQNIAIRRDSLEELTPNTYCFKMYYCASVIGIAVCRFRNSPSAYWDISEFNIAEDSRKKGYGSILLKYVTAEMWREQRIPICIYPIGSETMTKEDFIEWLVCKKFEKRTLSIGHVDCILNP
jgi:Acetyltransferase (GNAT) family